MADKDTMEDILRQSGVTEEERAGLDGGEEKVEKEEEVVEEKVEKETKDDQASSDIDALLKEDTKEGEEKKTKVEDKGVKREVLKGPKPLLDKDGKPLVEGGAQRRLFEKYRHSHEVEIPALRRELEAFKGSVAFKEHGLTPSEAMTGYALVKAWKEDPGKLINHLLTQAKAAGIKVEAGGSSVDMAAIKQLIADATKPLADAKAARDNRSVAEQRAKEVYETFLDQHSDASVHEEELAILLDRNPNLSLESAYYELKLHFQKNGLDWSQPLKGQIKRSAKPRNEGLPRSRMAPPADEGEGDEDKEITPMPASSSYSDIIKSAMKEAGYKI